MARVHGQAKLTDEQVELQGIATHYAAEVADVAAATLGRPLTDGDRTLLVDAFCSSLACVATPPAALPDIPGMIVTDLEQAA